MFDYADKYYQEWLDSGACQDTNLWKYAVSKMGPEIEQLTKCLEGQKFSTETANKKVNQLQQRIKVLEAAIRVHLEEEGYTHPEHKNTLQWWLDQHKPVDIQTKSGGE